MDKIKTIILKEWAEVFKNRMVIFTIIFMPLLFTAIPLIMLAVLQSPGSTGLNSELPAQLSRICPPNLDLGVCFQVQMVSQFMLLFMLMPLIIPVNIAAYSVVGEKTTRSLEPLLATPITTAELLTGKNLAAAVPAIVATLAGFLIFAVGAAIIVHNPAALSALLNPMWLLAVFLLGPLLAILSVNFSLMVSSRVNEPRGRAVVGSRDHPGPVNLLRADIRILHHQQQINPADDRGHVRGRSGCDLCRGAPVPARDHPHSLE